jgi:hypothetical protein
MGALIAASVALGGDVAEAQNHVWSRQIGGDGHDRATDTAVDGDGNVFVVGALMERRTSWWSRTEPHSAAASDVPEHELHGARCPARVRAS